MLRLGMRLVGGLSEVDAGRIAAAVGEHGRFRSIEGLCRTSGVRLAALRHLAAADAFGSMGLSRQRATWAAAALSDERLPLFELAAAERARSVAIESSECERRGAEGREGELEEMSERESHDEPHDRLEEVHLPPVDPLATVVRDCASTGLSLRAHPLSFAREELTARGIIQAADLRDEARTPQGTKLAVAGIVLVRQRPSTAKGIVFMTLEDESAVANIIVRPDVWQRHRRAARHGVILLVHGHVERQGQVVHVIARRIESIEIGAALGRQSRDFR